MPPDVVVAAKFRIVFPWSSVMAPTARTARSLDVTVMVCPAFCDTVLPDCSERTPDAREIGADTVMAPLLASPILSVPAVTRSSSVSVRPRELALSTPPTSMSAGPRL